MPHDPTPAQVAASRANGARSRGPSSAAGKARAALNATRHGVLGTELRLHPGEAVVLDGLLLDLGARLAPQGVAEHALVEELAQLAIRRRRLDALELDTLAALDRDGLEAEPSAFVSLGTIIRYRARLAAEERRILERLDALQARRRELVRAHTAAREQATPVAAAGAPPREVAAVTNEPEPVAVRAAPPPVPGNRAERRRQAALARLAQRRAARPGHGPAGPPPSWAAA